MIDTLKMFLAQLWEKRHYEMDDYDKLFTVVSMTVITITLLIFGVFGCEEKIKQIDETHRIVKIDYPITQKTDYKYLIKDCSGECRWRIIHEASTLESLNVKINMKKK